MFLSPCGNILYTIICFTKYWTSPHPRLWATKPSEDAPFTLNHDVITCYQWTCLTMGCFWYTTVLVLRGEVPFLHQKHIKTFCMLVPPGIHVVPSCLFFLAPALKYHKAATGWDRTKTVQVVGCKTKTISWKMLKSWREEWASRKSCVPFILLLIQKYWWWQR